MLRRIFTKNIGPDEYYIDDIEKQDKSYNVTARIKGSVGTVFTIPLLKLVIDRQDLLSKFPVEDIIKLVSLATSESNPRITIQYSAPFVNFAFLAMLFGTTLIISNILSMKLVSLFGIIFTGGQYLFPITYILGDVITEVYGYKRARILIWGAMICNLLYLLTTQVTIALPPAETVWQGQQAYAETLNAAPRLITASLFGYFVGEFFNSYLLAKMKISQKFNSVAIRLLSSSLFAIISASTVFSIVGFFGMISHFGLLLMAFKVIVISLLFEFALMPLTLHCIKLLKHSDKMDIYDKGTTFTPFSIDVTYPKINNRYGLNTDNGLI